MLYRQNIFVGCSGVEVVDEYHEIVMLNLCEFPPAIFVTLVKINDKLVGHVSAVDGWVWLDSCPHRAGKTD